MKKISDPQSSPLHIYIYIYFVIVYFFIYRGDIVWGKNRSEKGVSNFCLSAVCTVPDRDNEKYIEIDRYREERDSLK